MRKEYSLKEKLRKYALIQQLFLFSLVVVSLVTVVMISLWQKNILTKAIELYTEEEAKSLARILLYDLAFEPRLKRIAEYEEQLSIISKTKTKAKSSYPLGLKEIVKKNLYIPEQIVLSTAEERGYIIKLADIKEIKRQIYEEELNKECSILKDDLAARITFSDHLRGITISSKWGFAKISALEEAISYGSSFKSDLIKVEFPIFLETSYYGNVEILVDRGRLRSVQQNMVSRLSIIQALLFVFLLLALILSLLTWLNFFKKVENEIVSPIINLSKEMEQWKREEILKDSEQKDELKRLSLAFKDLVERFENQKEQLIKTEKLGLMQRVGAGLSHELNNALNPIKLRLDSILLDGENPTKEDILILREHLESAGKILKDLTALKSSKNISDIEKLKPSMWLDVAKRLFEPQVSRNVTVKWDYKKDFPEVIANKETLVEIVLNLLLNAKDAVSNVKEPNIVCSFKEEDKNGVLVVEDNGIGFPEEYLKKPFEPFYTTKPQGMGLGLFLVENYCKKLNGTLAIETSELGGAKVKVTLPIAEA
jgi:signal transduction histidine kinase